MEPVRSWSKPIALLLALLLSFPPQAAEAMAKKTLPRHTPEFSGQSYEGLRHFPQLAPGDEKAWAQFLAEEVKNTEKSNIERVNSSGDQLVDLMIKYKNFYAECRKSIDEEIATTGFDSFMEQLDTNKIKFSDPELGRMEFTTVDGEPVAKIVHEKSGVAFLIYDEDALDRGSEHFQKLVARQHYDAGSTRSNNKYIDENGKKRRIKYGRDLLIMGIRNMEIVDGAIEVSPRKRGLKHWWQATYKHPSKKEVVWGFVSGLAQFASIGALAELVAWVLPGFEAGNTPEMIATFTLAYGSLFGIWNSFYQNWRSRGPKWVRDAKNMSVSLSYYFGVYVISHMGMQQLTVTDLTVDPSTVVAVADSVRLFSMESMTNMASQAAEKVSSISALAIAAAVHPFHNFWANNEFKNVGYWLQRVAEKERRDIHNVSVMIPKGFKKDADTGKIKVDFLKIPTPMSRRFWNRQFLYYLPVNWAKFLDQVWFGWTIGAAMTGQYPAWMPFASVAAYWALIHGSIRGINWWAYRSHEEAAKELKIREESWYYFPSDIMQHSKTFLKERWSAMKKMFGSQIGTDCDDLLKKGDEDTDVK